ncbi:unnamed protein product [Blepharisma stoltei]|uniref:Dual specificity protein phosphatase n=1 Tax=Blepharisma stoltei TaxID=1481888 RepID=A0AAU9JDD0_9CILI|nr:unnamed protein product [Blepharisma stoltei]
MSISEEDMLNALFSPISQVDSIVYIGNRAGSQDLELLKSHNIKRILQIQSIDASPLFPNDFIYHCIVLGDSPYNDLSQVIPDALGFIADAISTNQRVFVHCDAGASRSGSIIVAYLIGKHAILFEEALEIARSRRACISPNPGFERQLRQLNPNALHQIFI